ncbi:MAG: AAA family ATPase [Saprospiraceae bacterium]|nr:AAA family ATPase [Saprospiraceae bacterium]
MSKEHLTYFKVENFKRFDSLELNDIGQFNLIVGDNNVGKTSVLEAISSISALDKKDPKTICEDLCQSFIRRNINLKGSTASFFSLLAKNDNDPIRILTKINSEQSVEVILKKENNPALMNIRVYGYGNYLLEANTSPTNEKQVNTSFIPANIDTSNNLSGAYQAVLNFSRSNKRLIINNLKVIDQTITDIEVLPIQEVPHVMIGFENNDRYLPLTSMGESAIRVFYYLLRIISEKGQRLMIDEIDTGIHYSRMKNFLTTLIKIAINNDVQLFMTTHSLECQQAFAEVFEAPDMVQNQEKVRQFTLIEKPDGQVIASGRDFEQLQSALETGYDTRGGERRW